ncbi:chondroitin AC/alginate lyase [Meira miltonrushii]|uniref:Chondroitin AC/alginate lyase n=1 Tax=Meira miltonrushii TaxID=1280837 RepID=A0A316VB61_9BASI|nr:chondroitin AC/alginate lyase [Meira miltonrushii]PWN34879.1 chondroitin AC/alginate lyase [Meira miltonrushii]
MLIKISTLLLCGFLAFANICAADNDIVISLTTSIGNLFSTPYKDINDMLSDTQQIDLDRVDWVVPESLVRLRQAPDQLKELAAVLENLKFLTETYDKLGGPWTVTNKSPLVVPDGDVHQYTSWARYFWPVNSTIPNKSSNMQKRRMKRDTTDNNDKASGFATTNTTSTPENSKKVETPDSSNDYAQKPVDNGLSQNKTSSASAASKDQKQDSGVKTESKETSKTEAKHNNSTLAKAETNKAPTTAEVGQNKTSPAVGQTSAQVNATKPVTGDTSTNETFPDYCANPDAEQDKLLVWKNCPYKNFDGQTNPDIELLSDPTVLRSACRAAFLNAVLYVLTGDMKYGKRSSLIIRYFFLDEATAMRPQMKYGQIIRGPARNGSDNNWTIGTFRGLVDSRHLVKAWNAVIILRETKCSPWTQSDDAKMRQWTQQFSEWLLNDLDVSITARSKKNNIKSWWYTQAIASNVLIENRNMTNSLIDKYFLEDFIGLIDAKGDQPNETNRTRPAHYRAFGIEPMIVNARLSAFVGKNEWAAKSNVSTTINDAIKFCLGVATQNSTMVEKAELAPHVATALAVYGDTTDQLYQKYLDNNEAYGDVQKNTTWRLFNRPDAFNATLYPP